MEPASFDGSTRPVCALNTLVPAMRSASLPLSATSTRTIRCASNSTRAVEKLT